MKKRLFAALVLVLGASSLIVLRGWGREEGEFPHATHVNQGLECSTCHEGIESSEGLKKSFLPSTSTCGECHEQAQLDSWGYAKIPARKSGFREFSHKAHLALGKDCESCHGALVHPEQMAEGKGHPAHGLCFECHDGIAQTSECEDCHTGMRESRLTGLEPDPAVMKPIDHHPGFLHNHQLEAEMNGQKCEGCHREADFCSTCHQGDNVDVLVHERNWLYTHPLAASKNLHDCQACHNLETFCSECHASEGVKPVDHMAANWATPGHNLHGEKGRRDLEYCASCHNAEDMSECVICHRDRDPSSPGQQPDVNPHPSTFRSDVGHGYWHDDPDAACFECHDAGAREAGAGFCGYCHGAK